MDYKFEAGINKKSFELNYMPFFAGLLSLLA